MKRALPFVDPSVIKLQRGGEKAEDEKDRRAALLDTCSAPFAKLEIYSSARDGNRSWRAKVTRHIGDASISHPLLARTLPLQKPLFILPF